MFCVLRHYQNICLVYWIVLFQKINLESHYQYLNDSIVVLNLFESINIKYNDWILFNLFSLFISHFSCHNVLVYCLMLGLKSEWGISTSEGSKLSASLAALSTRYVLVTSKIKYAIQFWCYLNYVTATSC